MPAMMFDNVTDLCIVSKKRVAKNTLLLVFVSVN